MRQNETEPSLEGKLDKSFLLVPDAQRMIFGVEKEQQPVKLQ